MGFPGDVVKWLSATTGVNCAEMNPLAVDRDDRESEEVNRFLKSGMGKPALSSGPSGKVARVRPESPGAQKTRIFVKTAAALVPVDVDLSLSTVESIQRLAAADRTMSLCFRGKLLHSKQTLKECGIELGSVLHLSSATRPVRAKPVRGRSQTRRGHLVEI
mmetsp:Transcript_59907/g.106557  ORF Transcript_59907/g.106557 Transcript_59907/m.106557 type:complete len:161 (+) Transcript_59907:52-534(+)